VVSILSAVIWGKGFEPSSREEPLKIGADLMCLIFPNFEFDFCVSRIDLNKS
jgi:hypothetical protein